MTTPSLCLKRHYRSFKQCVHGITWEAWIHSTDIQILNHLIISELWLGLQASSVVLKVPHWTDHLRSFNAYFYCKIFFFLKFLHVISFVTFLNVYILYWFLVLYIVYWLLKNFVDLVFEKSHMNKYGLLASICRYCFKRRSVSLFPNKNSFCRRYQSNHVSI